MPNINDAFPSKFLKASDLHGSEPIVTIDRVDFEPVGRDREMKAVVYFKGKQKGIVLNKTNANKIAAIAQSALTEDWEGVAIKLYATETEFGGETVECIRVKPAAKATPRQAAPAPRPVPVEREPAAEAVNGGDVDDIPF